MHVRVTKPNLLKSRIQRVNMLDEDLSPLKRRFRETPNDAGLALEYSRALERIGNRDDALMVLLDAY